MAETEKMLHERLVEAATPEAVALIESKLRILQEAGPAGTD